MIWPFDLRVSACQALATDYRYVSTDFGADSSAIFLLDRETRLNALPHAGSYTAGMDNNISLVYGIAIM